MGEKAPEIGFKNKGLSTMQRAIETGGVSMQMVGKSESAAQHVARVASRSLSSFISFVFFMCCRMWWEQSNFLPQMFQWKLISLVFSVYLSPL